MQEIINRLISELIRKSSFGLIDKNKSKSKKKKNKSRSRKDLKRIRKKQFLFFS